MSGQCKRGGEHDFITSTMTGGFERVCRKCGLTPTTALLVDLRSDVDDLALALSDLRQAVAELAKATR